MPDSDNATFRVKDDGCGNEAVCIDVMRVYDSCGSKDCLEDLNVYFSGATQALVDTATGARVRNVEIIDVCVDIEPLPFHKGYYSVNITYYFNVWIELITGTLTPASLVNGLAIFTKQIVMYASESNVKVYSSENSCEDTVNVPITNLPKANVQTADPISLGAKIVCGGPCGAPCQYIPEGILALFGGSFATMGERHILVSIGLFSIVQTVRNVQMLVPAYDFCVPCKECRSSVDSPCEVFNRIDFPTKEFFPEGMSCHHCDKENN